jgi:hypothetical protein
VALEVALACGGTGVDGVVDGVAAGDAVAGGAVAVDVLEGAEEPEPPPGFDPALADAPDENACGVPWVW